MNKQLFLSTIAAACLLLSSCSSGSQSKEKSESQSKEISPKKTEFRSGDLADYIEVVDEPAKLILFTQDEGVEMQHFKLNVKIRLKKEDDRFKNIDPTDIIFTDLKEFYIARIRLLDENGDKVVDCGVDENSGLILKKLLQQSKGVEETIVFSGKYYNPGNTPDWYESIVEFRPTRCADITIGDSSSSSSSDETTSSSDNYSSDETTSSSDSYSSDDNDVVETPTEETSSTDWDEVLNEYEEFVDKYISLMEKAQSGDMSALSEYPSYMEQAQEVSNKLANAKGEMSSSQLARYSKILSKMSSAIQ